MQNNGWQQETNFNYIQKGDLCFAGPYHTFLFMGWKDKAKGIAYVMGDEAYMFNSSYSDRNLKGQSANEQDGWNNQYKATSFWKYAGNFVGGKVQNSPVNKWIGRVSITSPVGLWMNAGPSANTSQITCIGSNIILNVIESKDGWYKVYYDGQYGWIDGQYTTGLGNPTESKSANVENANIPSNVNEATGTTVINSLEGLELNNNPSMTSSGITSIPNATKVYVFDQTNNGWEKVYYNGNYGWIYSEYTTGLTKLNNKVTTSNKSKAKNVTNSKNATLGQVTITSTVGLWMTEGPKPYSGNITCLNYNTTVNVIGESNGWYEINYDGQTGWIDGAYTTSLKSTVSQKAQPKPVIKSQPKITAQPKSTNKISGKEITIESPVGLWMTKGPKPYSGNITCIPYNTKVMATAEQNGWYKISYNGEIGWVDGQYTSNIKFSNTNISNTSSNTKKQKVSLQNNNLGQVTVTSTVGLWMTEGPKPYSGNITCLNYNTTVNVIGESNGWYEINYNGQTGWIDGAYTTSLKSTVSQKAQPKPVIKSQPKITAQPKSTNKISGKEITIESPVGLWMTKGPKPYSGNITCIPYNTKVMATAEQNGWYEISYKGETGWVDGTYTTSATFSNPNSSNKVANKSNSSQGASNSNNEVLGTVTVTSPIGLLMTSEAGGQGGVLTCLNNNVTVNVLGENNGWYKVSYNGTIGWVDGAYTTKLNSSVNTQSSLKEVTVASPVGLYMTYGPNGTGGIITCLPDGTGFQVMSEQNGWYEVNYNGQVGWIDGEYCEG